MRTFDTRISPDQQTAQQIAEALMVRTADALISGDFPSYATCFAYPTTLESFEGNRSVASPEELHAVFLGIRRYFAVNNVTDLTRKFIAADFRGPDVLHMTHESYALNRSTVVVEPVPVFSILRRVECDWKISHSAYALRENHELAGTLYPGQNRLTPGRDAPPEQDED